MTTGEIEQERFEKTVIIRKALAHGPCFGFIAGTSQEVFISSRLSTRVGLSEGEVRRMTVVKNRPEYVGVTPYVAIYVEPLAEEAAARTVQPEDVIEALRAEGVATIEGVFRSMFGAAADSGELARERTDVERSIRELHARGVVARLAIYRAAGAPWREAFTMQPGELVFALRGDVTRAA